jgi:hypothetical protein
VLVVLAAGIALSLAIDALVLAVQGISPTSFVARLMYESFLLGARLAISVAVVAVVILLGTWLARQRDVTLDQSFNAIAFAFAPLILAPLPALLGFIDPTFLLVAGIILVLIGLRAFAGLLLNLRAILPLPAAALALVLALTSGWLVLGDQISRVRMTAYAVAPQLAGPLRATPAQGKRYDLRGATLTVPDEWAHSVRGVAGEIAHFETATATLNVVVSRADDLTTMDRFADQVARGERFGFLAKRSERSIETINGLVAIDDLADGTYSGRHIALRQFAIVVKTDGMALQFRFFDPPDVDAALTQAAAIAATWRLGAPAP